MEIYRLPYLFLTYDTNRIIVSDISSVIILNQSVEFTIDASQVSKGQLEVAIVMSRHLHVDTLSCFSLLLSGRYMRSSMF